jgi:hypothetical protein
MKILMLSTACLMPYLLMAQVMVPRQPRPRVEPPSQQPVNAVGLKENITIQLQGTTTTGSDIDVSLTGIGPRFSADQVVNEDTLLTCEYDVSETETGYTVSYNISARIKVAVQSGQIPGSFEYRDVSISGTVLCLANHPLVLFRSGQKPLQLTISKEAAQAATGQSDARPFVKPEGGDKPQPEAERSAR